jgi:hypothetical protein
MKVDDEIVELKEWDAARVPPGTWRGYEAGPEGLEILVIGAPNLGEDPRADADGQRDWCGRTSSVAYTPARRLIASGPPARLVVDQDQLRRGRPDA